MHVWRVALEQTASQRERWRGWLDAAERAKADRFVKTEDRARAEIARGFTRELLGEYVGVSPAELRIRTDAAGKPRVHVVGGPGRWCFNVSHSGRWVLVAVAQGREVGVDVEQHRTVEHAALVESCFSAAEQREWRGMVEARRATAFFDGWARKEAYLKAVGSGLSRDLRRVTVPLDGEAVGPLAVADTNAEVRSGATWALWPCRVDADHAGAVAVAGSAGRLRRFHHALDAR